MARGALQLAAGAGGLVAAGLLRPFTGARGQQRLVRHLLGTAAAAGKLAWARKLPLYHVEKPHDA